VQRCGRQHLRRIAADRRRVGDDLNFYKLARWSSGTP